MEHLGRSPRSVLQKLPPDLPPERNPNLPDGLEKFTAFSAPNRVTRTKRHNSYYRKRKLLSAKQTFIEKLDKNKLPLAPASALFSFLKQYPFHTDVEKRPRGRRE